MPLLLTNNERKMKKLFLFLITAMLCGCYAEIESLNNTTSVLTRNTVDVEEVKCGTPAPTPPTWLFENKTRTANNINIPSKTFAVNIFIVQMSCANNLNIENISKIVIDRLNEYYSEIGINFVCTSKKEINSDSYPYQKRESLFNTFKSQMGINIFIYNNNKDSLRFVGGEAQWIPGNACLVNSLFYNTSVVAHEVGHCLGLYHTHHGTVYETGDANQKAELVNGTNSSYAGDYIIDTPADPCEWWISDGNCNYTITSKDVNGDTYNPNPHNIMSYAPSECHENFTEGQRERVYGFIANTQMLQTALLRKINGDTHLYDKSLYSVTFPNNVVNSIDWNISCTKIDRNTGTKTYNEKMTTANTIELSQADLSTDNLYNISAHVNLTDGLVYETPVKIITSGKASPYLGTITWNYANMQTQQTNDILIPQTIEIEAGQTKQLILKSYSDLAGNEWKNPTIDVYDIDLDCSSLGNVADITAPNYSIDGTMEIRVDNGCGIDGAPFLIPYVVFDVNNFSLSVLDGKMLVKDKRNIQTISLEDDCITNIIITDTYKNIILTKAIKYPNPILSSLDISSLATGTYYVKIICGDKTYFKKLIIK